VDYRGRAPQWVSNPPTDPGTLMGPCPPNFPLEDLCGNYKTLHKIWRKFANDTRGRR